MSDLGGHGASSEGTEDYVTVLRRDWAVAEHAVLARSAHVLASSTEPFPFPLWASGDEGIASGQGESR